MFLISIFTIFSMRIHATPIRKTNNLELIEAIDFAVTYIEEEIKSIEMKNELFAKFNADEILELQSDILKVMQSLNFLQMLTIIQIEQIKNQDQSWKLFCFFIESAITAIIFGGLIGFVAGIISIIFQMQEVDARSKKWLITFGSLFIFSLLFIMICIVAYFAKLNFPHLFKDERLTKIMPLYHHFSPTFNAKDH